MHRTGVTIIISLLLVGLVSCGQKGALYLPTSTTPAENSNEH